MKRKRTRPAEKTKTRENSQIDGQINLELIQYLENKFQYLESNFNNKIEGVRREVKEVNNKVDDRFDKLNARIDSIEQKYFKFIARWTFIFDSAIIGLLVKIAFLN